MDNEGECNKRWGSILNFSGTMAGYFHDTPWHTIDVHFQEPEKYCHPLHRCQATALEPFKAELSIVSHHRLVCWSPKIELWVDSAVEFVVSQKSQIINSVTRFLPLNFSLGLWQFRPRSAHHTNGGCRRSHGVTTCVGPQMFYAESYPSGARNHEIID